MADFNLVDLHQAIADTVPDRPAIVWGQRRWTWREVSTRRRRIGWHLRDRGLGTVAPHPARWRTGQDHVGLLLRNGNEYLEATLGVLGARAVPFNINWRYVKDEIEALLVGADARGLIYHAEFAPIVGGLAGLEGLAVLVHVPDASGHPPVAGAVQYDEIVGAGPVQEPARSPEDRYLLFTGGTTGRPKAVIWRQADLFVTALGGTTGGREFASVEEVVARASAGGARVGLAPAPFMHGSSQWAALATMLAGGTVAIQDDTSSFDPDDVWRAVHQHRVTSLTIVGEAFGGPLLAALDRTGAPTSLRTVYSGGAALSARTKAGLLARVPGLRIVDLLGSSESGTQAAMSSAAVHGGARFRPGASTVVLDDDRRSPMGPGTDRLGVLATGGRVPLAYLEDPEATTTTFPEIDGVRYTVPGDRVRLLEGGEVEFVGRSSSVINSAGEKIHGEEVEEAIRSLPEVRDVVVVGRPSVDRGSEVVALVDVVDGTSVDVDTLRRRLHGRIAGYKLPRAVITVRPVPRTATGKADYTLAREIVAASDRP